ncbi:MAG: hypothetical protein QOF41_716 [Methylobacteriaceae bacterium]|nr:hypothetical protein [Methylobacteriaceae bacterium]
MRRRRSQDAMINSLVEGALSSRIAIAADERTMSVLVRNTVLSEGFASLVGRRLG